MARKDEDKKKKKQYTTNISEAKRNSNGDIVSPYKGSKKTSSNKEYTTNIAEAKRDSDGNLVSPYKTSSTSSSPQETFNKPQAKQTASQTSTSQTSQKRNSMEQEVAYAKEKVSELSDDEKSWLNKLTDYVKNMDAIEVNAALSAATGGDSYTMAMPFKEDKKEAEEAAQNLRAKSEETGKTYDKYLQYVSEIKDAEDREKNQKAIKQDLNTGNKAKDVRNAAIMTAGDIVSSPVAGGLAVLENLKARQYADQDAPVNTNSYLYGVQNAGSDVESAVNERIDNKVGQFAYGTGVSIGKAALAMAYGGATAEGLGLGSEAIGAARAAKDFAGAEKIAKAGKLAANLTTLPMFGTSAYASTLQEAQRRGLDHDKAQYTAIAAGTAEMAFEELSLDHFWDIYKNSGKAAARNAIVNIIAQAGIEGSEEAATDIANAITDGIINRGESEYQQNVKEYGKEEATKMFLSQLGQDFLGGAISGGLMGGAGQYANYHSVSRLSSDAYGDGTEETFAEIRDAIPEVGNTKGQTRVASELKQTADLLRIKAKNNQNISQKEKNDLYQMQSFLSEQYATDDKYRQIVDEYKKAKVEDNKAQGFANFNQITNEIMTQKVTNPEMSEEAQVETELRELSPMDNMLVEESEGKSPAYISGVKGEEFNPSNIDEEIAYNEGQQYRTQRKSEENNPKTATAIRGNEKFKIASIKNVKGEPYITTDSGVTMPLSEASIVNDNVQTLYNNASKHDNAQAYIDGYNPNIPVKAYSSAMENVYNYARLHGAKGTFENAIKNEPYKDKIDKASLKAMYEEGLKDTQTKSKKVTKSGKKAQNKVTDENNRLSKNGRKLMKAISDKLGVDVEIVDNQMTVDGKTVNGFFDAVDNKIVLNPDGENVFKTLIHEVMGEMSEAYSSEKMDELQLAIIDYELAHNPKKFNDTVENYRQAYIKHEGAKSYREAADEYVNDILVELFNDEQGMKDFANFISDKQSVKETFLEFIDNIVSAIKELMGDNTNSRFKDDIEAMQRLRKMALDTWQTAIDNKLALENGETELKQASSLDVRNSIDVDTEDRELNDSQKTFFKNSKIVDEDGKLLVLYHGTPVGGFNEFRNPLNFFTPNRSYAERYANQDSKTGEIYEVYLNVEKPFDITNPEDRQIFIDEYVKGGWSYSIDPSLSDKEIAERIKDGIDWTEADNLKEFLEENDYDYDGLILNEGGDFEYGDRDNSYVIFESRQAKRVDNENPTKDADIRFSLDVPEEESKTLIAIHNLSAEKMMQSLDLGGFPMPSIAVTTTELGHTNYGDVSVLFGKDTVDPTKSRKNKIYGGDAWTPTVPRLESKVNEKVAEKIRLKIDSLVDNDEQRALGFLALDNDNLEEQINNRRGDVIDAYKDKRGMKYAFLKDNGIELDVPQTDKRLSNKFDNDQVLAGTKVVKNLKQAEDLRMNTRSYENNPEIVEGLRQALNDHFRQKHENALKGTKLAEKDLYDELSYSDFDQLTVGLYKYYRDGITQEMDSSAMRDAIDEEMKGREKEYEKWLSDLFDGIVEKQGLRNNKELFTYTGNRRSWDSLHDDYNLDNIVKIMSQQDAKGEAGFFSVSKIQALATKNFKNLSEVRKAKNQLRMETEEEHEARVDEQSERFTEICDEIKDKRESNSFIAFGRAADAIADAVSKYHTVQGIDRELREWTGLNIQDDTAQKIVDLMKDIAENPTGYFEAKPQRAVELSEIERVIVPHLEKDLMAALDEKNIPYTTYKAGDDEARKAAVNSVPEIRFSIEVDSEGNKLSRDQQRYFSDSKVVDDQGRLKVMYHGTEEATFTKFDLGKMDDGRSIFLTDSKIVAQTYSAEDSIVDPYNIHDLETEEGVKKFFEETDFELRKTEDGYEIYDSYYDDVAWKNESLFSLMMQYAYDMGMYNLNGGIYKTYVNLVNPLIVDAEGKSWDDLGFEIDGGLLNRTRDVAEYAYITGYDGVIFKGLIDLGQYSDYADMDGSSDVAVAFNPNQVKSTNNLHPTADEDIRYSVEVDTNGNKLSKDQVEYFADSKIRDGNGNLKVMYHGTRSGGFTIFNPAYSDDRRSLFFSDNKEVARSYTRAFDEDVSDFKEGEYGLMVYPVYLNVTNPMVVDAKGASWGRIQNGEENEYVADRVSVGDYTFLSQEDLNKFDKDTDILKINKAYNEAKKNGTAEYDGEEYDSDELLEMLEGFDKEYAKYFMNHRTNITAKEFFDNPQKYGWWDLYSLQTNYDSNGPSLEEIKEYADYDYMEAVQTFKDHIDEEIAEGYFDYDFYNDFEFGVMPQTGDNVTERDLHNTRWYSKKAQEEGYDGVIFKNLDDSIGVGEDSTIVVAFDSNQVKSIENKTPTEDADIRYSIDVDSEGNELTVDQQKFFYNSEVRDEEGRLIPLYHTTNSVFTKFNTSGIWLSEDKDYSLEYADKIWQDRKAGAVYDNNELAPKLYGDNDTYTMKLYANITNPFDSTVFMDNTSRYLNSEFAQNTYKAIGITNVEDFDKYRGIVKRLNHHMVYELFNDSEFHELLKKFGFDGIKAVENSKLLNNEFTVPTWCAFDSSQVKLATNGNPSENEDIRFSLEVEDKISDIKKRAEKRFSFDQADLDLLDSLAEGQSYNKVADDTMAQILSSINNLYKGQEVGAKSIQTVAKEIKEYTGSTISTSKLEEQLKTLFDYMQRADNELNTGEMFDMFKIVAGDVVDKMASEKVDDSFRDFMRTETFRLTDDQKKEVAHVFGSYENFRKKYYGTLKIRNDATSTLDGLWNEITEQSFYGLDRDTPEAEQPIALVDFLDAMKDQPINNFGASFDELSTDVAIRILEKYFAAEQEAMTNKALLDNPSAKKALDDARANMRKADQEFRKQVKEKYDEEVARLTKERDDAQSSSQFFYNRARDLENQLANASNEEDKKAIRKLQSELDKKEKALIKAQAQSKAPLSAYQEQLGRADEKRKIMQISNRLMKMVYAPTEKLHMPEEFREPIGEFLNGIDFITHRGDLNSIDKMRWQTRMDNLRHYLSELSSKPNATQNELNLAELLEDELLEDMEKFTRDHAEDKKISRMSKEDLHKLYNILTRLSATVSKTNETFANSVYADMTKLNADSYDELTSLNDKKVGNGVMQSIKDFFSKTLEDPVTYFSLLGKAPKTLFDGLLKGFDRRTGHIKEAQEYMNFLPKDAYKWEKQKHTFVINGTYDVKGEELELTTTQIMTLYELNKRKAASHHLFSGGIKALNTHLLGYTSQSRKAYHLTEADLRNIFGVLTTEQIEAADKMQEFMANNCADWGNNVSMTLWGYKKFTEKDYFPMKVDSDSRATSNKDTNVPNFYSNKNISASKELKEMADNPLVIGDIFDVFTEHVADMATYDGMVLPQMDAMRWFNYKVKEVDGQGRNFISGTKQELNRIYGQAGLSYFTNLMLGINGAEPKARGVRLQNALIGRYKKVAVTAKVRVAIQQPTAFVRAYDEMEGKYLTKALATTNPVKYSKIAKQNSNLAWWKGQGYYEAYLGKGLKEIIVGKNPVIQKVEDFEGWGAQTMDDLTWGVLYHASELEVKDKHPDLKGKEFTDAVVERFEDLVSKTQVVDTMLHRTDIMRSQGDLTKLATSFMTEPLKTYNMLMRSVVGAARDKDKKALRKLIRTLFVYVANAAILSMVTTTWDALRKDDDETKYTDKWLELYGQEAVDNLNPLQMIPFVKDVVDIVNAKLTGEYRNATDMTYEGITKAAQFVAHLGKKVTGEDLTVSDYGLAKEGVQALSILSGVPVYNVWNDIEGVHNGFFDNWETKVQSPYKDFYKAIDEDGDITDAVNKLHEEGKEDQYIKKEITSHYKQTYLETTDMTEKANLKNKLIKAYTAAGDTREQAIKKIDKW